MSRKDPPSQHLRDLAAQVEGEPDDEYASIPPDEMNGNHGRTIAAAAAWRLHLCTREVKMGDAYIEIVKPIAANVTTILRHHPQWVGVVAYDEFREAIVSLKAPPWDPEDAPATIVAGEWSDADSCRLIAWLARHERLDVPDKAAEAGLSVAAHANVIHPVRDYLRGLVWDGTPRLATMLPVLFGTAQGLYEEGVGTRWMISCVARIMNPGCQVDCTMILEGATGRGKTSAFRALVPDPSWYADSGIDVGDKDSYGALRAVWIYGLDELDSLRKGEVTRIKNFLTATRDHYRPPYAKRARDFLRQNVFGGTTNETEYLIDRTGNRRFWPVRVDQNVDVAGIVAARDQLWAEALHRYREGEPWHVDTPGFRTLCEAQQAERLQEDPWTPMVIGWIKSPKTGDGPPLDLRNGVATVDVLVYCLQVRRADIETRQSMRVGAILRELGYVRMRRQEDGERGYVYVLPIAA